MYQCSFSSSLTRLLNVGRFACFAVLQFRTLALAGSVDHCYCRRTPVRGWLWLLLMAWWLVPVLLLLAGRGRFCLVNY